MNIKWLGHASFLITSDAGKRIITDPYTTGEHFRYGEIDEEADIVMVTHQHGDHSNVAAVRGNPEVVNRTGATEAKGILFVGIPTAHDDSGGQQRGSNISFCFEVDGIKVCHLGDLGHLLSDEQIAKLGKVDVLLIPVGGYFTIDAKTATQVTDKLAPRIVIPMHFKTDKMDYPISGVDEFLQGKENVSQLEVSEVVFKPGLLPDSTQIVVLKPAL